jgi:hypothetical protein
VIKRRYPYTTNPITMKNIKRVRLKYVLPIFAAAVATLLLINSCKKNVTDPTITDTKVLQAKAWYESTYSVTSKSNNAPLATLSTSGQSAITNFSQRVSPDWQHSASYNRLNKDVVEMPIDPSSNYNFSLKNTNKAYSRTSFLILKSGNTYNAFVMLVVADSAYVNNDLSKLTHNTYRKHDADFSGTLIYFTPDGKLVSRYSYKNGKIVANSNSAQTTNTQQVQSLKTNTDGAAVISLV